MLMETENIKKWCLVKHKNSRIKNYPKELIRISNEEVILQIDQTQFNSFNM